MEWILFGLLVQEFWPRGPIALDACNGIMSSLISSYHRDSMLMHPSCVYVPCSGTLKLSLKTYTYINLILYSEKHTGIVYAIFIQ